MLRIAVLTVVILGLVAAPVTAAPPTLSKGDAMRAVATYERDTDSFDIHHVRRLSPRSLVMDVTERYISHGIDETTGEKADIELAGTFPVRVWRDHKPGVLVRRQYYGPVRIR